MASAAEAANTPILYGAILIAIAAAACSESRIANSTRPTSLRRVFQASSSAIVEHRPAPRSTGRGRSVVEMPDQGFARHLLGAGAAQLRAGEEVASGTQRRRRA